MSVTYLGTQTLKISELKSAEVSFLRVEPEVVTKDYVNHHILLADVSGSMYSNIRSMKERLHITLEALLQIPNSYVSVITYSGHRESKVILSAIKCDDMSYKMAKVYDVLDRELHTKSVTVISEPLEMSVQICKELTGVADKHHICLFTDGCLVPTSWAESKEKEKCFVVAEICKNQGIFLNAIGFGMYYDRRFLKELIDIAGNGAVTHIDSVNDYSLTILNIIKKVNAVDVVNTVVNSVDVGSKLFVFANSILANDNVDVTLTGKSNVIALIESSHYKVDGASMQINERKAPDALLVDDFYYSLARYHLQEENTDDYEYIVMMLGDTNLFNSTQSCYSFIEKGNAVNKVTECYEEIGKRFLLGRNPIVYSMVDEPLCLLEILQDIMNDNDSKLYWDINTPYHRVTTGTNSIEDNISFEKQKSGLLEVSSLDVGSEKLNIGIKVNIPGVVTDSISGLKKEACVFRSYNLVNGGNINVPFVNVKLSTHLFNKFTNDKGNIDLEINKDFSFAGGATIYKLNLNGIKSVNKRLLKSMTMSEIVENLKVIKDYKAKNWALGQLIKEVIGEKSKVDFAGDLSVEEIELRKLFRIDDKGIYKPISSEKDNASPFEIYSAVFLTWDVDYDDKKMQQKYLTDFRNEFLPNGKRSDDTYTRLNALLEATKKDMRSREFLINCIRLSAGIIGKSPLIFEVETEEKKTKTNKILSRNMVVNGTKKVNQKVLLDTQDIVRQEKWLELVPCN